MRGILQREMSGYEEKEVRIKGSGSNSRELENSRNESCVDAHGFPIFISNVIICITVLHLKNCLGAQMS